MLKVLYFVSLSYMVITADARRCKPDYFFNYNARGWLKLHWIPATWQEAFLRCRDEGVPLSDMEIEWSPAPRESTAHCLTMSIQYGTPYYMSTSSCNDPLPFICYRKFGNETINECGTFDDEYHFDKRTGSCYKVHHKIQSWTRAYGICASEGGHLVILNDKEEARIIKDMLSDRDRFHVGLRAWTDRNEPDRIWTTIHGESFEDVFNEWKDDQPNNLGGIQGRGSFVSEGALDDIDPDFDAMFVCEKSPTSIQFEVPQLGREELLQMQDDSFNQLYCNQI